MELSNFYAQVYMKAGAGVTLTTQAALTTALAFWTNLFACETGLTINTSKGADVELTTGDKIAISENLDGAITFLEVTEANYAYLRATFNKKECSVILNKIAADGTGICVQVQNIIPHILREFKSGDLIRVKITFKAVAATHAFAISELAAT